MRVRGPRHRAVEQRDVPVVADPSFGAAEHVQRARLPRHAARHHQLHALRERLLGAHAHGGRQVAVLPAPRARRRRRHCGRIAPRLPDPGPAAPPRRDGHPRGGARLGGDGGRRAAERNLRQTTPPARARPEAAVLDPGESRALRKAHERAGASARSRHARAHRDRRGALHLVVGPRFPQGLQGAAHPQEPVPERAGDRADGDRDEARAGRLRATARVGAVRAFLPVLQPNEHHVRRGAQGQERGGRHAQEHRRAPRRAAGPRRVRHRVLLLAEGLRDDRGAAEQGDAER